MSNKTHEDYDPRPICPECGYAVYDATKAAVLFKLKGDESWIVDKDALLGVYCCSNHLLDAYLRGWPAARTEEVDFSSEPSRDEDS